jgi:hypothetical protein
MSEVDLRRQALQWGTVGVVTAALVVGVGVFRDVPPLLLGMVLFGVPLFVVPLAVGITDAGIDTAAGASRIGFGGGQAEQYNPGSIPVPGKLQVVLWLSGVGLGGFVVLAVAA